MKELSLNILDITENSVKAGALLTEITLTENEEIVEEALARGETHVELKNPTPLTKYNPAWQLICLDDDPTQWPNFYVAKYYGLESISGS